MVSVEVTHYLPLLFPCACFFLCVITDIVYSLLGCLFSGGAPAKAQWMQAPQAGPNCPPGLEYLTQVDQLLVHQQVELFEG